MRFKITLAILLLTLPIAAQPVVTSISPSSGPVAGGTTVTVTGSGFETCPICSPPLPPQVSFGGVPATELLEFTDKTLVVKTPPHPPATVDVTVEQWNGSTSRADAFTFFGKIEDAFDRVLLPLFTGPVEGAHGSRFITQLRLGNPNGFNEFDVVYLFGIVPQCVLSACIPIDPLEQAYEIRGGEVHGPERFEYRGTPGAFAFVTRSSPRFVANLRVHDDSRTALNFGTEMPVVHEREFTTAPIKLLGVPNDSRFRNTLRVYATAETSVSVLVGNFLHEVFVRGGATPLDPAYAELPVGGGERGEVTITPSTTVPPVPGFQTPKVWAFISVTNNETQLITTITPQP